MVTRASVLLTGGAPSLLLQPDLEVVPVNSNLTDALAKCTSRFVVALDAKDTLSPTFIEHGCQLLEENANLGFVTSWTRGRSLGGLIAPMRCDLPALMADPTCVHRSSVFRREAWVRAGSPEVDDELTHVWLRLLQAGFAGTVVAEPAYVRDDSKRPLAWQLSASALLHMTDWAVFADAYLTRNSRIIDAWRRHRSLFARAASLRGAIAAERERIANQASSPIDFGDLRRGTPWAAANAAACREPLLASYAKQFISDRLLPGRVLVCGAPIGLKGETCCSLSELETLAGEADTLVLTDLLTHVRDPAALLAGCARALRKGGLLLVTAAAVSRCDPALDGRPRLWRLTPQALRRLLTVDFDEVRVTSYGNAGAAVAVLYGLGAGQLPAPIRSTHDPLHPVLVAASARARS